jgi:hypothetical protein
MSGVLAVLPAAYGFLPPGFFGKVRNQWLALYTASKSGSVSRDA